MLVALRQVAQGKRQSWQTFDMVAVMEAGQLGMHWLL